MVITAVPVAMICEPVVTLTPVAKKVPEPPVPVTETFPLTEETFDSVPRNFTPVLSRLVPWPPIPVMLISPSADVTGPFTYTPLFEFEPEPPVPVIVILPLPLDCTALASIIPELFAELAVVPPRPTNVMLPRADEILA